jgi:hypothetical protein
MMSFTEDALVAELLVGCAEELVAEAADRHGMTLDYSDDSVALVEKIAGLYYDARPLTPPDPDAFDLKLRALANDLGGYVGEVFRRNHAGTWGRITDESTGDTFPGMKGASQLFWPTGRARNRLTNGPEDNIWHYYVMLLDQEAGTSDADAEPIGSLGLRARILRRRF